MADEALKYLIAWCDEQAGRTLRFAENMRGDPENAYQDSANFDACSKALSELARLRGEREWKPIETAPPHHHARVIVARDDGAVGEARFFPEQGAWYWANMDPTDYVDGRIEYPTHWQPLPAPPVQSHEEKQE